VKGGSSTVRNLSFWYPEQVLDDVAPYPPTIARFFIPTILQNLTFYNAYVGYKTIHSGGAPVNSCLYGTFLKTGIIHDKCSSE
jgi:hypothetical protein